MMKKSIAIILFINLLSVPVWAQAIKGKGELKKKEIAVGSFKHLYHQSSMNLVITNKVSKITIEADENLLDLVNVSVNNGVLTIKDPDKQWFSSKNILKIYVPAQPLNTLRNEGSGNLFVEEIIESDDFKLENQGSGNLVLRLRTNTLEIKDVGAGNTNIEGQAQSFTLVSGGSGNLNAEKLQANTATVEMSGSGNAKISCKQNLSVTINGTGNLSYLGSPTLVKQLNSIGKIYAVGE
jgi:hypothetical protein